MNESDYNYYLDNLKALDPDQIVSDLGLTTEEIMEAFSIKVNDFIEEQWG